MTSSQKFSPRFCPETPLTSKGVGNKNQNLSLLQLLLSFFLLLPTLPISNLNFLAKMFSNGIETKCMCFSLEKKFLCCRLFLQPGSLFLAAVVLGDTLGDLLTHFFLLCLTSPQIPNGDYSYYIYNSSRCLSQTPIHPPAPLRRIFSRLYTLFHLNIKPC